MTLVVVVFSPIFLVIDLIALVFGIVTIVDMARRPTWQWRQAGSNKTMWLVFEILFLLIFSLVSIVIGIVYFAVTRPKLLAVESQGGGPGGYGGYGGYPPSGRPSEPPGYGGPGYGALPGAPPTPYPPPRPQGEPQGEGAGAPPAYPGGGPPPYPGSAPVPPYPGSAPVPPHPGPTPGGPPAPAYTPEPRSNPPFGWYPDPSGQHEQRYWDGTRWTENVSDGGQQAIDALPS